MNGKEKSWVQTLPFKQMFFGGLGALLPIAINIITVDITAFQYPGHLAAGIYGVKMLIFFSFGCAIAYFYKEERDPKKIFQLGISAPAIFFSLANGHLYSNTNKDLNMLKEQYNQEVTEKNKLRKEIRGSGGPVSFYSSYTLAQFTISQEEIKTYSTARETAAQQVIRGITGGAPKNTWFVVVGSYSRKEGALGHAKRINQEKREFHASVYAPYGDYPYYNVVIGEYLALEEALELKKKAVKAGFPGDTFLKSLAEK